MNSFEKQKMREWLIKQRDGLIIGEYRNQICMLFKGIEALCSTFDYCNIDQLQNHFKNTMFEKLTILSEYAKTLEELEYIEIFESNTQICFKVRKNIDF